MKNPLLPANKLSCSLMFLIILLPILCYSQEASLTTTTKSIEIEKAKVDTLNRSPQFPGGNDSLFYYINTNLKYPEEALKKAKEGKVIMSYVIDKTGKVRNVNIDSDSGLGCADQVKQLFLNMPSWKPSLKNGIAIDRKCNLVIGFHLKYAPGAKLVPDTYTFWRN